MSSHAHSAEKEKKNISRKKLKIQYTSVSHNTCNIEQEVDLATYPDQHFPSYSTSHLIISGLENKNCWTQDFVILTCGQRKTKENLWFAKLDTITPRGLNHEQQNRYPHHLPFSQKMEGVDKQMISWIVFYLYIIYCAFLGHLLIYPIFCYPSTSKTPFPSASLEF